MFKYTTSIAKHIANIAKVSATVALFSAASLAQAQTISPAMIEQFKNLPRPQQEALAKQYGINLSDLGLGGGQMGSRLAAPGEPIEQVDPEQMAFEKALQERLAENEKAEQDEDGELPRYGLALFDRDVSTFAPTDNAQVPDDYRLGVGDEVVVQLFGKDNDQLNLEVNREGQVSFPKLGPVNVAGFTFEDAKALIKQRVAEQLIGVEAVVSIGRLRAINVFMAGEVVVPGAYSVSALATVSQALYQAGGVTDIGTLRNIQVKRNGKVVADFDVYDLLLRGDASSDVRLRSGDVVFVPPYDRLVTVEGEVKRPMRYEVENNETIANAIAMAGGFKSSAFKGTAVLVQQGGANGLPVVKNIALNNKSALNSSLNDGDSVRIMPIGESLDDAVLVKGAVVRPGVYGWQDGLRVSDIIGDIRRDLLPDADLGYALIIREKNSRLDIDVLQFDVANALQNKGSEQDPMLFARDQVMIFQQVDTTELAKAVDDSKDLQAEAEAEAIKEKANTRQVLLEPILEKLRAQARANEAVQIVSISGAVKAPGEYPLGDDYTARDLIMAAGGLKDSAYLAQAEKRRLQQSSNGANEVVYSEFDLNEALTDGGPMLTSRDHISVRETADWNPTDSVTIEGEVMFPGTYLIQRGETLSDIVRRAGGLTDKAFAPGAVFTRETIADIETERAKEFAESVRRDFAASVLTEETITASFADIQQIADSLEKFEGQGRLLVRLNQALNGDDGADIALMDGDKLVIPQKSNTVTVVGEVRRQGTHSFEQGLSLDDYLGLSAGMTARADDGAVYIVRADGSVSVPDTSWTRFSANNSKLMPGDTIVVPVDSQHKESIALWRDITQIIYQGTVAIAAVARL